MNLGGWIKNSFVDYPRKIATVIFTCGCNFKCGYCHNNKLIDGKETKQIETEIFNFLEKRVGLIDGVVISGGEPTIQPDLPEFVQKICNLGYYVKLDTNGSNPQMLQQLINNNLLDYVAMDVKTSFQNYSKIAMCDVDIQKLKQSIQILESSRVNYEFRTTFASDVSLQDIENIAKFLPSSSNYFIQKFNPQTDQQKQNEHRLHEYAEALLIAKKYITNAKLRSL
ncbi:MAG: anaerobic ribonucleoside-triphosphate reductase activating protein [Clostridia bacterium]